MKKVDLAYNPFLLETQITIDGKAVPDDCALFKWRNRRMQEWVDSLFDQLMKECKFSDIEITFKGTKLDFEDICGALENFKRRMESQNQEFPKIELKCPKTFATNAKKRFDELKKLFFDMQRECPFPELQTEKIKRKFQDAIDTEFDVAVVATMSSGKSTLINAFLGRELMPSKQGACTATITRIKDDDKKTKFSAVCRDKNGKIVAKDDDLTLEAMKRYNDDDRVLNIDIEGEIPFVSSEDMQLVLHDTPGPNNSRTEEHRNRTLSFINDDINMPMVLYVMANDNVEDSSVHDLLNDFTYPMKLKHGKQARDRFIFVINKLDEVKKDEPVTEFIQKAKDILKEYDIEDANIYPVSAEFAKLARMKEKGDYIDEDDCDKLECKIRYFPREGHQLNNFAPSQTIRDEMQKQLDNAKNELEKTLIYTGVPALEAAIAEYVEKYAITNKINTAVNTFYRQIREKELMAELHESLSKNEKERERVNAHMKELKVQIKDGKSATIFRGKIEALDFRDEFKRNADHLRKKYLSMLSVKGSETVAPDEARRLAEKLKRKVPEWEENLRKELQKIIKTCVIQSAHEILNEYRVHVQSLLNETELQGYDFDIAMDIVTAQLPDVDDLLRSFTETKTRREKVGEEEVKKDTLWNSILDIPVINLLTIFFDYDTEVKPKYKNIKFQEVNTGEMLRQISDPVWKNINKNIKKAENRAEELTKEFKTKFIDELDDLNAVVTEKAAALEKATSSKEKLNAQIEENRRNEKWLIGFQQRLETIINI